MQPETPAVPARYIRQCATCGRAVWSDHVDTNGNCVLHNPQPAAAEPAVAVETPPAA